MTNAMIANYCEANMEALNAYKANILSQADKVYNTPKDIPVGAIFTQHWLNSITYYIVTRTTKSGVEFQEIPDTQVAFKCHGGLTGDSYVMPNFVEFAKNKEAIAAFTKEYGDPNSKIVIERILKNGEGEPTEAQKAFWNLPENFKKTLKIVKPSRNGGFYIPGVKQGSWCGDMRIWNGEPINEYYE